MGALLGHLIKQKRAKCSSARKTRESASDRDRCWTFLRRRACFAALHHRREKKKKRKEKKKKGVMSYAGKGMEITPFAKVKVCTRQDHASHTSTQTRKSYFRHESTQQEWDELLMAAGVRGLSMSSHRCSESSQRSGAVFSKVGGSSDGFVCLVLEAEAGKKRNIENRSYP